MLQYKDYYNEQNGGRCAILEETDTCVVISRDAYKRALNKVTKGSKPMFMTDKYVRIYDLKKNEYVD